jgi:hypothetical protein
MTIKVMSHSIFDYPIFAQASSQIDHLTTKNGKPLPCRQTYIRCPHIGSGIGSRSAMDTPTLVPNHGIAILPIF